MKKIVYLVVIGFCLSFFGCGIFGSVDPIGPDVQTGSISEATQTSFRISGTIKDPSYKNSRQRKKSGSVVEYGFAYGVSNNPAEGVMKKVGDTIKTSPLEFSTVISGLAANTPYRVWAYAKTEAGLTTFGNEAGQQTIDFPTPVPVINSQFLSTVQASRAPAATTFSTTDNTPGAVYLWSFGESGATSNQKNPTFVYQTGGVKTVTLTIKANGKEATRTANLTILPPYQKVTISRIKVVDYLQSFPNGTGWDIATTGGTLLTGGPDMFIFANFGGATATQFYSNVRLDVIPAHVLAGNIWWNTPLGSATSTMSAKTFSGSELSSNLTIQLRDLDGGTVPLGAFENMGFVTFQLRDYMTGTNRYPAVVTRQGNSSTENISLKLEITFTWAE